jgi:hypothetical protein
LTKVRSYRSVGYRWFMLAGSDRIDAAGSNEFQYSDLINFDNTGVP